MYKSLPAGGELGDLSQYCALATPRPSRRPERSTPVTMKRFLSVPAVGCLYAAYLSKLVAVSGWGGSPLLPAVRAGTMASRMAAASDPESGLGGDAFPTDGGGFMGEGSFGRLMEAPGLQDPDGNFVMRKAKGSDAVPLDQQPFNELQELKNDGLFAWGQMPLPDLVIRLACIYAAGAFLSFQIAHLTFPKADQIPQLVAATNVGALAVVSAVAFRLYTGWDYVGTRLGEDVVAYEESGWYDLSTWVKPPGVRARDQLLNTYEVKPVLRRLRVIFLSCLGATLLTGAGYKALQPSDPYEQFSDQYLQNLISDDEKANAASEQAKASGKPLFCQSRYYRALAGASLCDD
jgi:hypothetical protein